jgi:hypothetical protein
VSTPPLSCYSRSCLMTMYAHKTQAGGPFTAARGPRRTPFVNCNRSPVQSSGRPAVRLVQWYRPAGRPAAAGPFRPHDGRRGGPRIHLGNRMKNVSVLLLRESAVRRGNGRLTACANAVNASNWFQLSQE